MAKGMALPVRANKKGGARLIEASPYARQVIMAGLTPNHSRNPFQAGGGVEVGISEKIVFSLNSAGSQAGARREINRFFARARAAEIAKLADGRYGLRFETEGEEIVARIKYVELEADKEGEVSTNLKDALRSSPSVNASGQ
jgi:hypothetical protein